MSNDIPQGQDYAVLLFLLPKDPTKSQQIQDRFLCDRQFWANWLPNLQAWTQPLGVTRTETPDGQPALALLLTTSPIDTLFEEVGHQMAEDLEVPAYSFLYTALDPAAVADIQEAPKPW